MIDMGVFFVVLLVGFAYLWKRGDLDWVRAVKRVSSPCMLMFSYDWNCNEIALDVHVCTLLRID